MGQDEMRAHFGLGNASNVDSIRVEWPSGVVNVLTDVDANQFLTIVEGESCCIGLTGNVDNDPGDVVDLGDLTALIDYLFISMTEPDCMQEANCDGDVEGTVDLGDLTALIDYLFISFTPPAPCQ
jgi:hypothetical protein